MIHNKYFEILEKFLGDYNARVYGRSLVGKVTMSQKNIALTLSELEKENILLSKVEGKQKYYFLNKQNPLLKQYLLQAEIMKTMRFMQKHPKLKLATDKIKGNIVCIFGSYAKETEKPTSDIDLFVVDGNRQNVADSGQIFSVNFSPQCYSEKQFIESIKAKNPLIKEIISNHVIIKGFEEFIEIVWEDYYGY